MNYDEDSVSNKSQMVTLVLLLFLGRLGAHRFYVRKYITGLLYLIVGTCSTLLTYFDVGYAFIAQIAFLLMLVIDLYALYSDSFTDKSGLLVLGKSKVTVYESYAERDQKIFEEKINKIILVALTIGLYVLYFVVRNYVF